MILYFIYMFFIFLYIMKSSFLKKKRIRYINNLPESSTYIGNIYKDLANEIANPYIPKYKEALKYNIGNMLGILFAGSYAYSGYDNSRSRISGIGAGDDDILYTREKKGGGGDFSYFDPDNGNEEPHLNRFTNVWWEEPRIIQRPLEPQIDPKKIIIPETVNDKSRYAPKPQPKTGIDIFDAKSEDKQDFVKVENNEEKKDSWFKKMSRSVWNMMQHDTYDTKFYDLFGNVVDLFKKKGGYFIDNVVYFKFVHQIYKILDDILNMDQYTTKQKIILMNFATSVITIMYPDIGPFVNILNLISWSFLKYQYKMSDNDINMYKVNLSSNVEEELLNMDTKNMDKAVDQIMRDHPDLVEAANLSDNRIFSILSYITAGINMIAGIRNLLHNGDEMRRMFVYSKFHKENMDNYFNSRHWFNRGITSIVEKSKNVDIGKMPHVTIDQYNKMLKFLKDIYDPDVVLPHVVEDNQKFMDDGL